MNEEDTMVECTECGEESYYPVEQKQSNIKD